MKTNAIRILEKQKFDFEVWTYEVDESDLSAEHVAESMGVEADRIFKTLVLQNTDKEYFVAVIPGNAQVDLKKMAQASKSKKCDLIPMKDLLPLTGYIRGGCSPIGMKKQFPTFVEECAQLYDRIIISAGKRGLQIVMSPQDLVHEIGATYADLI